MPAKKEMTRDAAVIVLVAAVGGSALYLGICIALAHIYNRRARKRWPLVRQYHGWSVACIVLCALAGIVWPLSVAVDKCFIPLLRRCSKRSDAAADPEAHVHSGNSAPPAETNGPIGPAGQR